MTTHRLLCERCDGPINDPERCFEQVTGWVKKREQGGTNSLRLKESLHRYMHTSCMELEVRGIPRGQSTLV